MFNKWIRKGQSISEGNFGVFKSPKKWTFFFCFDEPRIKLSNPFFVFCVERLQAWRLPNFLQIFRYHQCYQIAGLIHFSCSFWCLWNVILCWLREILMTHLSRQWGTWLYIVGHYVMWTRQPPKETTLEQEKWIKPAIW